MCLEVKTLLDLLVLFRSLLTKEALTCQGRKGPQPSSMASRSESPSPKLLLLLRIVHLFPYFRSVVAIATSQGGPKSIYRSPSYICKASACQSSCPNVGLCFQMAAPTRRWAAPPAARLHQNLEMTRTAKIDWVQTIGTARRWSYYMFPSGWSVTRGTTHSGSGVSFGRCNV